MEEATQSTEEVPPASVTAEATEAAESAADEVPPPPPPPVGAGPAERRARVQMLPHEPDDGPTYYRIGVDHEYEQGAEEIHFQCTRIKKLENLEAAGPHLKKLVLIANCIEKIENLESNINLEHLELYQNLVKKIENISHLSRLHVLDLSFNKIRLTSPLAECTFDQLEKLYISSNKIDSLEGVFHFPNLTLLELGSNRLRGVPNEICQLERLEELWLGRNKIVSMGLPRLPSLRHLSLQNNRLEAWDAALFHNCPGLTHLYLGHNNLPDLPEEFALLTQLVEVDLAKNAITTIRPFPQLERLEEMWLNDNQITDLAEVRNLAAFPALTAVYLERNPMHGLGNLASEEKYKDAILDAVPELKQLDAIRLGATVKLITDGTEKNVVGIRKR